MTALSVALPSKFDRTNLAMSGQNDMEIEFCPVNDLTLKKSYFVPCRTRQFITAVTVIPASSQLLTVVYIGQPMML